MGGGVRQQEEEEEGGGKKRMDAIKRQKNEKPIEGEDQAGEKKGGLVIA